MNINNTMNQYKALSLILLMMAYTVSAESIVYITDEVDIPIRTNKSTKSEIIRLMPTGSELSVLQSTEDGWTQIKMGDSFGWILTAFVSSSPPARDQLKKLTRTYNTNKLLISKLASEKEVLENQFLSVSLALRLVRAFFLTSKKATCFLSNSTSCFCETSCFSSSSFSPCNLEISNLLAL